jgi:hypothetical protein
MADGVELSLWLHSLQLMASRKVHEARWAKTKIDFCVAAETSSKVPYGLPWD